MNRYRERDAPALSTLPPEHKLHDIHRAITLLLLLFLGLSFVFFGLTAIADSMSAGGVGIFVWGRVITEIILGGAYFLFAFLLRRGKFWGYMRMLMTTALALVSTLSVVALAGDYPWWLRIEQVLQAGVIVALLWLLIRPEVRSRFAKKR